MAYLIRSVKNQFVGISRLTDDYLNTEGILSFIPCTSEPFLFQRYTLQWQIVTYLSAIHTICGNNFDVRLILKVIFVFFIWWIVPREAPAMFKWNGIYYLWTSHLSGLLYRTKHLHLTQVLYIVVYSDVSVVLLNLLSRLGSKCCWIVDVFERDTLRCWVDFFRQSFQRFHHFQFSIKLHSSLQTKKRENNFNLYGRSLELLW